jgi:hypothetical protein
MLITFVITQVTFGQEEHEICNTTKYNF